MAIQNINAIQSLQNIQNVSKLAGDASINAKNGDKLQFGSIFDDLLKNVAQAEIKNQENLNLLVTGDVLEITKALVGMAEADLTIKFAMEVRNKVVDAYKEIMQMQV